MIAIYLILCWLFFNPKAYLNLRIDCLVYFPIKLSVKDFRSSPKAEVANTSSINGGSEKSTATPPSLKIKWIQFVD